MSGLEIVVVIAGTVWLGSLTLMTLVLVRQTAILSVRLQRAGSAVTPADDGLMIGTPVPDAVAAAIRGGHDVTYLLVLSANCSPCREFARQLVRMRPPSERIAALVPGREELASSLVEMLPAWIDVIRDAKAKELADDLSIKSTPFAFEFEFGKVTGKAFLHGLDDLERLMAARRSAARVLPWRLGAKDEVKAEVQVRAN